MRPPSPSALHDRSPAYAARIRDVERGDGADASIPTRITRVHRCRVRRHRAAARTHDSPPARRGSRLARARGRRRRWQRARADRGAARRDRSVTLHPVQGARARLGSDSSLVRADACRTAVCDGERSTACTAPRYSSTCSSPKRSYARCAACLAPGGHGVVSVPERSADQPRQGSSSSACRSAAGSSLEAAVTAATASRRRWTMNGICTNSIALVSSARSTVASRSTHRSASRRA